MFGTRVKISQEYILSQLHVERASRRPLYVQIEDSLESMVAENNLKIGDQIPGSTAIARHLDINELTARKAIHNLVQRKVLITLHGRGTYVTSDPSLKKVLWVCGVDVFTGDVSPYFTHLLYHCQRECDESGIKLEPVWLGPDSTKQSESYCNEESSRGYAGYFFVGCSLSNRLLCYVQRNNLHHVVETHEESAPRRVTTDYHQGLDLAIKHFVSRESKRVLVMCLSDYSDYVRAAEFGGIDMQFVELPPVDRMWQWEQNGYQVMQEILAGGAMPSSVLIMDDIVARGATRAMLNHANSLRDNLDLVVMCGRSETISLGLPVTYLVHDTLRQASEAIRILRDQIEGRFTGPDSFVSQFSLVSDQILADQYNASESVSRHCLKSLSGG